MQATTHKSLFTAIAGSVLLAACGGGGSDAASSAPANTGSVAVAAPVTLSTTINGVFDGRADGDQAFTALLQDDGSYFLVFSGTGGTPALQTAVLGSGQLTNGSFTSDNGAELKMGGTGAQTPVASTLSVSYAEKKSFNGNLTYTQSNQGKRFASTYNSSFETLPDLAALAGDYTGSIVTNAVREDQIILSITADGTLRGKLSCGCNMNAALAPRKDGMAYVATVAMTGGDHPLKDKSISGNIYLDTRLKRLYIVGTILGSKEGAIFVGTRS